MERGEEGRRGGQTVEEEEGRAKGSLRTLSAFSFRGARVERDVEVSRKRSEDEAELVLEGLKAMQPAGEETLLRVASEGPISLHHHVNVNPARPSAGEGGEGEITWS